MDFRRVSLNAVWIAAAAFTLAACGGGGGSSSTPPVPGVTPTPIGTPTPGGSPTPTPPPGALQGCNAISSTTTGSVVGGGSPMSVLRADGVLLRPVQHHADAFVPGQVAITVRDTGRIATQSLSSRFKDATVDRELHFDALQKSTIVLHTAPGREDALIAAARATSGVESASRVSYRFRQSTPATDNDPYFPMQYSASAQTYIGQWDMHFIRADYTWGLGATAQGSGVQIAVVDTGADLSHPDLQPKVTLHKCFVSGAINPTGTDVSDLDGHGTNVSGIAAAATNNNFGFAGVGNQAGLMVYKVFPNPPAAGCSSGSTNPACGASSTDIASAVNDAAANGAKVINLSLGGGGCTNGVDNDGTEQAAIANALAKGVVVVAASGNNGATTVIAPACITNVIAVGATSLNDTGYTATSNNPQQYVASYSNYDQTNPNWGIVAPGGDPASCESQTSGCTVSYQHWIENIYSSQVPNWKCPADLGGQLNDCRVLIAGTSQATPHVTGAVALILGINGGYTPATMKTLLCTYSDPVTGTMLPANGTTKPPVAAGCGALDTYRAASKAMGLPDPGGTGTIGG